MSVPPEPARFLFVICQVGAEKAVKGEVGAALAGLPLRLLAARVPDIQTARTTVFCPRLQLGIGLCADLRFFLGKGLVQRVGRRPGGIGFQPVSGEPGNVPSDSLAVAAQAAWYLLGDRPIRRIHVWERDRAEPGDHGFEPSITPAALATFEALRTACPRPERLAPETTCSNRPTRATGSPTACWSSRISGGSASIGPVGSLPLAGRDPQPRHARRRGKPCLAENGRGPAVVPIAGRGGSAFRRDRQFSRRRQPVVCWGADSRSSASIRPKWPRRFWKTPSFATFAAGQWKFRVGRSAKSAGSRPT